ncbi:MAG: hypothetical protein JWM65_3530 [Sphingomonas bacterium]|nr:hypothetical protein [Sphingomonas bacterium]
MVAAENNVATLQRWKGLADADWQDVLIGEEITARIGVLQAAAALAAQQQAAAAAALLAQQQAAAVALAAQQAAQAEMTAENVPATAYDYPTYQTLAARNLRKDQKAAFFIAGGANAAVACAAIVAAGQSDTARKKALIAFSTGVNQVISVRIAGVFDTVTAWRKGTVDIALLEALVGEGVLTVHKRVYRDNPMELGAVYSFWFVGDIGRVQPEWHIHVGVRDAIKSASWKSSGAPLAHGAGARVDTDGATTARLKAIVG